MPKKTFTRLNDKKKGIIIEGAIKAFNKQPYDKVTVADIVKHCHIPRGSFYQYFQDKFDLFMYLLLTIQKKKMAYLEPALKRVGKDPFLDLYMEMFEAGFNFADDYPALSKIGYHLYFSQDPDVKKIMQQLEENGVKIIQSLLEKDQRAGHTRPEVDMEIVAIILYRINARDVLDQYYKGVSRVDIYAYVNKYLEIIRKGIEIEVTQ